MPLNDSLRSFVFRTLRLGFRMMPMPTTMRDRLRQRFLAEHGDLVPRGPTGQIMGTTAMRAYDHAAHRALGYRGRVSGTVPDPLPATVVAFYLPQFHPIPENDQWWGPGFTEWRNVTRALPQFEGHVQPKLPADLGFYDLRLPQVMHDQMAMAREYGVGAFCSYFYWFAGQTLLESPLRQWLENSSLDLPMCLCWANENWSRRWDGREDDLLISQRHSPEDDIAFIEHVAPYLRDPRYLRVNGIPILLVYRPGLLPDPYSTAQRWRSWCKSHGVGEIHLAYVQSFDNVDPTTIGFDAAVAFPPNNSSLTPITATKHLINPRFAGQILDWRDLVSTSVAAADPPYLLYPGVNPGWDNEARRPGNGRSFVHATPRRFGDWVRASVATARRRSPSAPLVFVNAWNEWAEGAILEPDIRFGYAWLEALRQALQPPPRVAERPCVIASVPDARRLEAIVIAVKEIGARSRVVFTVQGRHEEAIRRELNRLGFSAELFVSPDTVGEMWSFLAAASHLLAEGEEIALRLPADALNHGWRLAREEASWVQQAFAGQPHLGIILPDRREDAGADMEKLLTPVIRSLCASNGLPTPGSDDLLSSRAPFWCRLAAIGPVIDGAMTPSDLADLHGLPGDLIDAACGAVLPAAARYLGFNVITVADERADCLKDIGP